MSGNTQVFDEIVDPSANKQVQDLTADLAALDKQAVDTAKSVNQLNAATANSTTFSQLTQNTNAASVAQERLQQIQNRTAITANNLAASNLRLQQAQDKQAASANKQAQSAQKAQGEYAKLVAQYNAATLAARNAGVEFGADSAQFLTAAERVRGLRTQLDAIDQPLGNFQRNVGNYANSIGGLFTRLYGYVRTAANILPGLGISGIFLGAFEGLSFLADKLGIISKKVDEVKTDFQKAQEEANKTAAEEITKLDTLYAAATNANIPFKERITAVKELQKEYPAYFANLSQEAILAGQAKTAYDNLTQSIVNQAVVKAGETQITEALKPLIEIITEQRRLQAEIDKRNADAQVKDPAKQTRFNVLGANNKPVPGLQDVVLSGSRRAVLQQFVDDETTAAKDLGKNGIKSIDEYKNGIIKKIAETRKSVQQIIQDLGINSLIDPNDAAKPKKEKKAADNRKQLYEEQLKALKLAEDAVLQSDKSSYEDRLKAINDYYNNAYDLTTKYSRLGVLTQQQTNNKLTEFDIDTTQDRKKIQEAAQKELVKLFKDGIKDQEDAERASIEVIQKAGDDRVLIIEKNAADAILALSEQYASGLINEKTYQKQLAQIQDQADIDRIDQEIITTQAIIDLRKGLLLFGIGSAKELQSAEDKLAREKLERVKAGTKAVLDGVKDEVAAKRELHQREKELADDAANFVKEVVDGGFENQINRLQELSDQIDKNADKEKQANNDTLLSAKDKADKNAIIDAKATQQKAVLAEREKQIKIRQAEFDRALNIAKIIEATAVAVVEALPNLVLAGIVSAIGAVEIATVLATPLPAFKDGGVTAGGAILWGEAGTERADLPSGQVMYSNGPTIQDFPRGTIITPHMELMHTLKPDKVKHVGGEQVGWKELKRSIDALNKPVKRGNVKVYVDNKHAEIRKRYFN